MRWWLTAFLFPLIASGAIVINDRGTGGNNTSGSSITISPASTLSAGNTGFLAVVADNITTTTNMPTTNITDSKGNVWVPRQNFPGTGASGATQELASYTSLLTSNLTSSDTITFNFVSAITAKAWAMSEMVPNTAGNIFIMRQGTSSTSTATGTPSLTSPVVAGPNVDVTFGYANSQSADTWVGASGWSTKQSVGFGSGGTGMSIISQNKLGVSPSAQPIFNPTLTSATCRLATIMFSEAPPVTRLIQSTGSSEASTTVTFTEPLTAGSTAVLLWAGANANQPSTNLPTTLTDSASNTWTQQQDNLYSVVNGNEIAIYTSTLTSNIPRGGTVTITYTGVNAASKGQIVFEFANATGYSSSGGSGSGSATSTPTITTGSITTPNIVVAMLDIKNDQTFTADSDTTNGSWSSPVQQTTNVSSNHSGIAQYKAVTASGAQTFNPGATNSANSLLSWVELTVPSVTQPTTNGFFLWP
jgi:hypothetical protein